MGTQKQGFDARRLRAKGGAPIKAEKPRTTTAKPVTPVRRKRQSQRFGRAWLITVVIAGVLLIVSAIVFAISSGTRRITEHAQALHVSDESLLVAMTVRAQLGFGVHLAAVEREFGTDTTEQLAVSISEARQALGEFEQATVTFSEQGGRVSDELATAHSQMVAVSRSMIQNLEAGESLLAEADASQLETSFREFGSLMVAERDYELSQVQDSDAFLARLGDIARFLVALLIPLAVIIIYREIVRRQQRQAELEIRLDAEREVGKARDDFVANASHEFRTPLTSIYGLAQLLEEDPELPEGARDMAEMISTEAADLSRMVEDLLTSARLEAGALTFQSEQVLTHEEVAEVVRPFERNGQAIETQVAAAVVRVDRLRQRQVLRNLLSNARKYGGPDLRVAGRKDGDWFVWTVADDGDGIPAELEARLFTRFMHQGTTIVVPGGVGLGLSIVKALVEGMGGTVSYHRRNGWTEFEVRVPLAVPKQVAHASRGTQEAPVAAMEIAASSPYKGRERRDH
jgi:signal transduction histidine kinase